MDITAQQRTLSQMKTMTDVSAVQSQISHLGRYLEHLIIILIILRNNTLSRATGKSNAEMIAQEGISMRNYSC
jgi:hypothetical protein